MTPRILRAVDKRQPLQPVTSCSCVLLCRWLQNRHHPADNHTLADAAAFLFPQYLQEPNRGRANALPLKAHLQPYSIIFPRALREEKFFSALQCASNASARRGLKGGSKGGVYSPFKFLYRAFSRPVASLNSLMRASSSSACAWTASQVPLVSYHRAFRSFTSRACCSTQV